MNCGMGENILAPLTIINEFQEFDCSVSDDQCILKGALSRLF